MTNYYTNKKNLWVKVAFILDRCGGENKELCNSAIIENFSSFFPKQTPESNSLTNRIKMQVKEGIFEVVKFSSKNKGIRLIDFTVLDEHYAIMEKWENDRIKK
jgi:hypothetical protein